MIYCRGCGRKYPLWRRLLHVSWACACGIGKIIPGRLHRGLMVINPRATPMRQDIPDGAAS